MIFFYNSIGVVMKLDIIKFDHFGRGLGKQNNKIIFIEKALPKEIVDIDIINEKKNYCEGKIVNIIKENCNRIKSVCPYYDSCGGCNLLHMKKYFLHFLDLLERMS